MYKAILITLGALSLSACSEQTQSQAFLCDEGSTATLINTNEEDAILEYNQNNYQLTKQRSASGVKYSNDNALFWSKDNEAMLIINGNKHTCNLQ